MSPEKLTVPAMPARAANAQIAYQGPAASGGFLERPFVQNILPFLTSLSLHSALLIIGLLTYTAIQIIRQPTVNQVVPADTVMMEDSGMPTFAGMQRDMMSRQALQNVIPNEDIRGTSFTNSASPTVGGAGDSAADSIIQVGAGASFSKGGPGVGNGPRGPGQGEGLLSAFGPTPQIGIGGPVFVSHNGARRIAFVCDASGSMINKMASLKMELAKAITGLRPTQSFSVIFFQDLGQPRMLDSALLRATPENKRKAGEFLENIVAAGTTEPLPGIEAAFKQQPELIYLLTDGDFPNNDEVLARIRALNKGKKVRVNTIAFVGSADTDTAFIDLLKTIASENGGTYRHVAEEDLQ